MAKRNPFSRFESFGVNLPMTLGKIFFVADNSDAWFPRFQELFDQDMDGETKLFTNLDTAVGACLANRGDVILVAPSYSFSVTAAAGLALDVAGITIIGLGNGTLRPTITLTTSTNSDIDVDAANITVDNVTIDMTGVDAIVAGLDVNASNFTLKNSRVILHNSSGQATRGMVADSNVDFVTIDNCVFEGDTSVGMETAIQFQGTTEGHRITNSYIYGSTGDSRGLISFNGADTTSVVSNIFISDVSIWNKSADSLSYCIHGDSNTTLSGFIVNAAMRVSKDSGDGGIRVDGVNQLSVFNPLVVNNNGERGAALGVALSSS